MTKTHHAGQSQESGRAARPVIGRPSTEVCRPPRRTRSALLGTVAVTAIGLGAYSLAVPGAVGAIFETFVIEESLDQSQTVSQENDAGVQDFSSSGDAADGDDGIGGAGEDGGDAEMDAEVTQANVASQEATISGASADAVSVVNSDDFVTADPGLVATSRATGTIEQAQAVTQASSAEVESTTTSGDGGDGGDGTGVPGGEGGDGGDASVLHDASQANVINQSATIEDRSAGDVSVVNSGDVVTDQHGIAATTRVTGTIDQGQDAVQDNAIADEAVVVTGDGGDGGDGALAAGDGGDGGDVAIEQTSGQVNVSASSAEIGNLLAGDVAVVNSGDFVTFEYGIAATSEVIANITQAQNLNQTNGLEQSGVAVAGAGGDGGDGTGVTGVAGANGGDLSLVQDGSQANVSNHSAGIADLTAGDIGLVNNGGFDAGGFGITATSQVIATIDQTRVAVQDNAMLQEAVVLAGDGGVGGNGLDAAAGVGGDGGAVAIQQISDQVNVDSSSIEIGNLLAGDVAVVNSGALVVDGDGIAATSRVAATITQTQDADQANGLEQSGVAVSGAGGDGGDGTGVTGGAGGAGGNGGDLSLVQDGSQVNVIDQSAGIAGLTAGDIKLVNGGSLDAGGFRISALSQVIATIQQTQDAVQDNATAGALGQQAVVLAGEGGVGGTGENDDGGAGGTGGTVSVQQDVSQTNVALQGAEVGNLYAGEVTVTNGGTVDSNELGLVARSQAIATFEQFQEMDQSNGALRVGQAAGGAGSAGGSGGDAVIDQYAEQVNVNHQSLAIGDLTAGNVTVDNIGAVNGIVASSSVGLEATQDQTVDQVNELRQHADAIGGEATGGTGGTVTLGQESNQVNVNEQSMTIGNLAAGVVTLDNSGAVAAGGNGIAAISSVTLSATQTQDVTRSNMAMLDGSATGSGTVGFTQDTDQVNVNQQDMIIGNVAAGAVTLDNSGAVTAGGDGLVAVSSVDLMLSQTQQLDQANDVELDDGSPDQINVQGQDNRVGDVASGSIAVTNTGDVEAGGRGLLVASRVDGHAGTAGTVSIATDADIQAGGEAIVAESSVQGGLGADITVAVEGGTVRGGNGYFGISLLNGADNEISNSGTVTSLSNQAISGSLGNETVRNDGVVTGDVDLGAGANAFFNNAGGTFNTWDVVNLNGGALTNSSVLAPGGTGAIHATSIDGDFVNTGSGQWLVDLDMVTGNADILDISGTASLDGEVVPTLLAIAHSQDFTIATAAGGTIDEGLGVSDSFFIDYEISYPTFTDVVLTATFDMTSTLDGLNDNQQSIGEFLNRALVGGMPEDLADLYQSLFSIGDVSGLAAAYDMLSPELYLDTWFAEYFAAREFSDDLLSCSVRSGAHVFIDEGQCGWVQLTGRALTVNGDSRQIGSDEHSVGISGGVQYELRQDWHLGLGASYERTNIDTDRLAESDGDRLRGGFAVKHTPGPWLLAAAVSGGFGWYDSIRPIVLPGLTTVATGDHQVWDVTGQLRLAHQIDVGQTYLKPRLDLAVSHIGFSGFEENGGPEALSVREMDETVFSASPALELGSEFALAGGAVLRPYVTAGATALSNDDIAVSASFLGAPGVSPFTVTKSLDRIMADVGAGVELLTLGGASLRMDYSGRFSNDVEMHALDLRGSVPF